MARCITLSVRPVVRFDLLHLLQRPGIGSATCWCITMCSCSLSANRISFITSILVKKVGWSRHIPVVRLPLIHSTAHHPCEWSPMPVSHLSLLPSFHFHPYMPAPLLSSSSLYVYYTIFQRLQLLPDTFVIFTTCSSFFSFNLRRKAIRATPTCSRLFAAALSNARSLSRTSNRHSLATTLQLFAIGTTYPIQLG